MKKLAIDEAYLLAFLKRLLRTPSPSGMTDVIVAHRLRRTRPRSAFLSS